MTQKQVLLALERAYQKGFHNCMGATTPDEKMFQLDNAAVWAKEIFNNHFEKKPKTVAPADPVYTACVDFWLKEFHPGWTFGGMQGKAMKSIIVKMRVSSSSEIDEYIINSFKQICKSLPGWFKDKDLQIIDSKFNEIITQIVNGPPTGQWNQQNSAARTFGKYSGL